MAGRHTRRGRLTGWRRSRGDAARDRSRSRLARVTDAGTLIEHLMTGKATADGHGRYVALCGARVLPASLTPPGGFCPQCAGRPVMGVALTGLGLAGACLVGTVWCTNRWVRGTRHPQRWKYWWLVRSADCDCHRSRHVQVTQRPSDRDRVARAGTPVRCTPGRAPDHLVPAHRSAHREPAPNGQSQCWRCRNCRTPPHASTMEDVARHYRSRVAGDPSLSPMPPEPRHARHQGNSLT